MVTKDKTARKNVSHFSIFDYWKDKAILENGKVVNIKDAMAGNIKYQMIVYDWGEPSCWGCDKPIVSKYEKERGDEVDSKLTWNDPKVKSELQKCHIVPRAKGGEDTPSNLFLMCSKCHEQSPDTVNASSFFRWVYDQRTTHTMGFLSPKVICEKVQEMLARRGVRVTLEEVSKVVYGDKGINPHINDELNEYLKSQINTHWNSYTETTLLNGYVDWLIHKYVGKILEG